ncbi:MAG: L,D-transpeptidase [Myxococcales bacterium]|nr:L,D-transpeptidase [Myxococcales bacterium]
MTSRTLTLALTVALAPSIVSLARGPAHAQTALLTTGAATARAPQAPEQPPRVVLGTNVRSMRVLRAGEILRARPDGNAPRRGTAALGALLPALEAALGPGCQSRWVRVGRSAWVCQSNVEPTNVAPAAQQLPPVRQGAWLPYEYAFAAFGGVRTYRTQQDALNEDWAEQLERSMGVALTSVQRFGGQRWGQTASGRWIAYNELVLARPSDWQGALIDESVPSADRVGFARGRALVWPSAGHAASGSRVAPRESVAPRELVVAIETATVRGRPIWRTPRGWIDPRHLFVASVAPMPANLAPNERWVDIDTRSQMLVAYEGTRPVYFTLISSGRRGFDTRRGEFRAWIKLATTDMSNADDPALDTSTRVYSVERVPWVLFFNGDQALHGVYWHDRFGTARSHGCVNLAPKDARWIFEWAPPVLPAGWEAVFPTEDEPGLRVRVR